MLKSKLIAWILYNIALCVAKLKLELFIKLIGRTVLNNVEQLSKDNGILCLKSKKLFNENLNLF